MKALAPGIEVRVTAARNVRGTLQSVADDSLVVNSGKGLETIARREVSRVSVRQRGRRKGNVLIGTAVGAGVGLLIGATVGQALCIFCSSAGPRVGLIALGAGGFAGIGALIGAVIPTGGWRDVYKSSRSASLLLARMHAIRPL